MVERERECTFKNRLTTGQRNTGASSEDRVGVGQGVDEVLVKISGCAQNNYTVGFKIEERTDVPRPLLPQPRQAVPIAVRGQSSRTVVQSLCILV
jgi:hypothetical protein